MPATPAPRSRAALAEAPLRFRHLSSRIFNTPLLATPEAAASVANVFADRIGFEPLDIGARSGSVVNDDDDELYTVDDGIATIAVRGELVNRGSWMDAMSGLTSYDALRAALNEARDDSAVRGILLDIDSPGGEAGGAFEIAALVREVSEEKKVVAFVDTLAASAAYAISCGASEIVAMPSSALGSIGVVTVHMDRSAAMKDKGVKPTIIHAGAYKVDGNAFEPLPDDARGRIQARIDEIYDLFVTTVGNYRPKLGREGARQTEAGVYFGARAVEIGLADRIGSRETLGASFPRPTYPLLRSINQMKDEPVHTQAALDSAVATAVANTQRDAALAQTAAVDAARVAARTEERSRIGAILNHESAKGRIGAALVFALDTDMKAEVAVKALAATPAETPAPAPAASPKLDASKLSLGIAADAPEEPELSATEKGRRMFAAAFGKTTA